MNCLQCRASAAWHAEYPATDDLEIGLAQHFDGFAGVVQLNEASTLRKSKRDSTSRLALSTRYVLPEDQLQRQYRKMASFLSLHF